MSFDLLVAGGGSAGLAAAISAARTGARTLLVERHGALGGMATAALVHSICGLYELAGNGEPVWANPGFAPEFARRLLASGGASGPVRMGRVHVLLHQPAAFARVADELAAATPNLEVLLHTEIISADSSLHEVELSTRGARRIVSLRAVVDATGDGALAALAGAPFEMASPDHLQRPAFIFGLHGVNAEILGDDGRLRIASQIALAVSAGVLPEGALGTAIRATGRGGEAYVTVDLAGPAGYDPTDSGHLTALEVEGRALAWRLVSFFQSEVNGFAACAISAFPARVGIRESRRVVGRYRLEASDIENGRPFFDAVARATWPIELRESNRGARLRYPADGRAGDIPLRSLRARDHANLFMAGRCLSCDHGAQASIRVMGTCFATGEAAGVVAALHADGRACEAVDVLATCERLRQA